MARLLTYGALVVTALILQFTVLDCCHFPVGSRLTWCCSSWSRSRSRAGRCSGLVTGFAAGLALDLAPPASHAIGAYALVFCLTGYACGRAAGEIDRSALPAARRDGARRRGGSVLYTVVGVTFGEPGVTWAAARNVLPLSVVYGVLLSPFVLYLVLRLTRWAGQAGGRPCCGAGRAGSAVASPAGRPRRECQEPAEGAEAAAGTGGPRRRIGAGAASLLAASGRSSDGWAGGAGVTAWQSRRQPLPRFRFGPSKPPGMTGRPAASPAAQAAAWPVERAGTPARPAPGVFTGGSLVGGSQVRLRLGTGRASRLRSRTGRVFGLRPHGHQPSRPKFTAAQPGSRAFSRGALGTGQSGAGRSRRGRQVLGRYGSSRSGLGRFLRPRRRTFGRPPAGGPRPATPRFGGGRFGAARPLRSRPRTPRAGWMRSGGTASGFRRSWLSGLRPRGGWSARRRLGGKRNGGFR